MMITMVTEEPHRRMSRDERRQLVLETTLSSLARNGAEGTSLRSVCRDMGVVPSLMSHFFSGWHEVLAAAYSLLTTRFLSQLVHVPPQEAADAHTRMGAMIRRYLSTDWAGENTVTAMLGFWQLSRSVADLQAPFGQFLADRHAVIRDAMAALFGEAGVAADIDEITSCFILMMDGIWLHMSVTPGNITPAQAENMCWGWLADRLDQPSWRRPPVSEQLH